MTRKSKYVLSKKDLREIFALFLVRLITRRSRSMTRLDCIFTAEKIFLANIA